MKDIRTRAEEWLKEFEFYDELSGDAMPHEIINDLLDALTEAEKQIDCRSGDEGCDLYEATGVACYRHLYYYGEQSGKTITAQAERISELEAKDLKQTLEYDKDIADATRAAYQRAVEIAEKKAEDKYLIAGGVYTCLSGDGLCWSCRGDEATEIAISLKAEMDKGGGK